MEKFKMGSNFDNEEKEAKKNEKKDCFIEVTTRTGDIITVDTSDDACMKFGRKHGEHALFPNGYGSVKGVADGVLWISDADHAGRVIKSGSRPITEV